MATSTEQINDLINGYTNLKQYFEGIRGDIDTRLNAAASRWDDFHYVWYVDQATGSDDGNGNTASPLQSIHEAINRTPFGGRANIRIRGRYDTTRRYAAAGRKVHLYGCAADWSLDDIDMHLTTRVDNSNRVETNGFQGAHQGFWEIYNINLKLKSLAQVAADHPGATHSPTLGAIFSHKDSGAGIPGGVMIRYSSVDITDDPYAWIMSPAVWAYSSLAVVYPHSPAGRFIAPIVAGTPSQDVPNLHTNISTL